MILPSIRAKQWVSQLYQLWAGLFAGFVGVPVVSFGRFI
jgi:hypothetical protein